MRRHGVLAVLVPLLAVLLGGGTGCGLLAGSCGYPGRPDGLTEADLVGAYTGDPFGRLELKADGTFTVADWRGEIPWSERTTRQAREREERRSRDGHGEWELVDPTRDRGDVAILFQHLDGMVEEGEGPYSRRLSAGGSRSSPTLFQHLGDPDVCDYLTFSR